MAVLRTEHRAEREISREAEFDLQIFVARSALMGAVNSCPTWESDRRQRLNDALSLVVEASEE